MDWPRFFLLLLFWFVLGVWGVGFCFCFFLFQHGDFHRHLENLQVVLKDETQTLTVCFGKTPDSRIRSWWKDGIKKRKKKEKKDRSLSIYINIYYIAFSVSAFGFCKVHFYSCYIMWKTLADLFKGKTSVNSLFLESVFFFCCCCCLSFFLFYPLIDPLQYGGLLGTDWSIKKIHNQQLFGLPPLPPNPASRLSTYPRFKKKATRNVPFSMTFVPCSCALSP